MPKPFPTILKDTMLEITLAQIALIGLPGAAQLVVLKMPRLLMIKLQVEQNQFILRGQQLADLKMLCCLLAVYTKQEILNIP